ncbi:2-oxoacid:acceptor oxidoreductase subunit alpha [uncultured Methanomethylovorans sp.]|uniref:2-oxoacid:acceptor oxidoreductase subunit alpha n=1 Tax=uncultured Methanomethylovorans sp. TaxID=183759 RepID=UPI002AA80A22|nr:2-oxoacid:acceptor oxidoreductase subunit alpha [uncultured Methanomethylovorans sp.]
MDHDINIRVGGEAGQGIQTIGLALAQTFQKTGLYVFSTQYYLSRVRGGHNYFQIRVSDSPIKAISDRLDLLIALDSTSVEKHMVELNDGIVLLDREEVKITNDNRQIFNVPFQQIARDIGGSKLYASTVATGAVLGLLCCNLKVLEDILKNTFAKKGEDIININIKAARAGYEYAQENYSGKCKYSFEKVNQKTKTMLINGNDSVGLGALAAGVQFLASYPMTPSTGVMNYIAAHADKFNVVVEQAEDEISALNMVLGASFAGARAMTTTSGGGFCLMTEALGLAGMTETPAVIFLGQRPGPATGLPTMTEQGDLLFALYAAQGEFPRCILAPKTPDDAFYLTAKAFNLADKYQIPVFIMSDQYLADSQFTCERFDASKITIDRHMLSDDELGSMETYKRYTIPPDGISPRALPGQSKHVVVADSDEHNEEGHIDQTADNRILMMEKRMRKLNGLTKEMEAPEVYGPHEADVTLIGWGSSYGPLTETVDILNKEGQSLNLVHFNHIFPMNKEAIRSLILKKGTTVCVESNATGQFAKILKTEADIPVDMNLLRYDGMPFTSGYLIRALREKKVI